MTAALHPFDSQTNDQRRAALKVANETRRLRTVLKAEVRERGAVRASDVILNPPDWARTMRLRKLLECVPKVGPVKARRIMQAIPVADTRTLGGLTDRQRRSLAVVLGTHRPSGERVL